MADPTFLPVVREWLSALSDKQMEATVGDVLATPEGGGAWSRASIMAGAIVGAPADPEAFA